MQILCEVNQAECFRRGIDAPRSTMKIVVDPAKLPQEIREFLADHLYEGDKLSARDDFQLLRPDLLGFMETVLTAKEYKEASDYNHTQILFDEWIKGAGKDGEAKREKIAKELVDAQEAQEAHPVSPRKHPSTRLDRLLISHELLRCFQGSTNRNPDLRSILTVLNLFYHCTFNHAGAGHP